MYGLASLSPPSQPVPWKRLSVVPWDGKCFLSRTGNLQLPAKWGCPTCSWTSWELIFIPKSQVWALAMMEQFTIEQSLKASF